MAQVLKLELDFIVQQLAQPILCINILNIHTYSNNICAINIYNKLMKFEKIIFNDRIAKSIVKELVLKTPGIQPNSEVIVNVSKDTNTIDVTFTPLHYLCNIFDVCKRVQDNVYYTITQSFDLYQKVLTVNVKTNSILNKI